LKIFFPSSKSLAINSFSHDALQKTEKRRFRKSITI
jgi:hypothetical protein